MPQSKTDLLYNKYRLQAQQSLKGDINAPASNTIPSMQSQQAPQSIWDAMGSSEYPEWYQPTMEESPSSGILNAVGVGLWSFVDTAAFGIPGALVEEEKFLDYEDPIAKWTGAIGGFAGFVAGAPLKVGAKIAQKGFGILAKSGLKKVGKESAQSVIRGMRQRGLDGGLSRGAVKEITGGYKKLVSQASVDPRLRGAEFGKITKQYLDEYIKRGLDKGVLDATQSQAIKNMFNANVFKRPLQDFKSLMKIRGLAQTNPRLARVIGHSIDDAVMFGAIDTIFEGVSMIEDKNFDWTAPLWGAGTGALFGQLSWLKPRGKAAQFKPDFMAGVKAAFGKKGIYDKLSPEEMSLTAKFLGEQLIKQEKSASIEFAFGGKKGIFNLKSGSIYDDLQTVFGDNTNKAFIKLLEGQKNKFGKGMMKWAATSELQNIGQNWRRMAVGGVLFNAHSFYDMYAHDLEADVNTILPNFLIGAYVQRRSNPAKFDLNPKEMNQLRQNLTILGTDPKQMSAIPTFDFAQSRFDNPFLDPKFDKVREKLEELEIITDSNEIASLELGPDAVTAAVERNPIFDRMYPFMEGLKTFKKPLDHISAEDAKTIADLLKQADAKFETTEGTTQALEETFLKTQKNFELSFRDLIDSIDDPQNILGITQENKSKDGERILRIPSKITISEEIKLKAKNGELDWLRNENNEVAKGEEALDLLFNKTDGFNATLKTVDLLNYGETLPSPQSRKDIQSESLLKEIFEKVSSFESNVVKQFPNKSPVAEAFSLSDSFGDYIGFLTRNHGIRFSQEALSTFASDFPDKTNLMNKLIDAGVLQSPGNISEALIIDDIKKVKITGKDIDSDTIAKDLRLLGRVLTLQSSVGGYKQFEIDPQNPIEIPHSQVENLRNYLNGINLRLDSIPNWLQSQLTHFAFNKRLENTDLKIDQTDGLFNLVGIGGATFGATAEGKTSGFTVKLIDLTRIQGHQNSEVVKMAEDYNNVIRRIIDDGKGLVIESADKLTIVDDAYMMGLSKALSISGESSISAKQTLAEFMSLLSAQKKGYSSFSEQLKSFLNSKPGNDFQAVKWLTEANVFTPKENLKDFDIDVEKFTDLLKEGLQRKMSVYGYTPEYAKERHAILEQKGRDNLIEDSTERGQVKHIDLNTFYDKYRIDGIDQSQSDSETKASNFESLVYLPGTGLTDKILNSSIVRKVLDRIHIKKDDEFISLRSLDPAEQRKQEPKIRQELIGLLGSQRAQMKVDVFKYKSGDYVKEEEVVQLTRLESFLTDGLKIKYMIVDGRMNITTLSKNGKYYLEKQINIFEDGDVISDNLRKDIKQYKQEFIANIEQELSVFTPEQGVWDLQGENGERGLRLMNIGPNTDPIVVAARDLPNLKEPFKQFINEYKDKEGLSPDGIKVLKDLESKIDKNEIITPVEYEHMLTHLTMKEMLTGSDGERTFLNFLNGTDAQKTMERIKLFNTKKYTRFNKSFIQDVAEVYMGDPRDLIPTKRSIDDKQTALALRKILRNDGFGVAIWNDAQYATIKKEVQRTVDELKLKWDWDSVIGKAHEDVSAFDSISFISRDMMRAIHAMMGHDPNSFNPLKPVITSGGKNSPLLLGKTLFVYSESLDSFFKNNKSVDIMITKTGAKVINPVGKPGMEDASLINTEWQELNNQRLTSEQIRKISIESLGIMSNKDAESVLAKKSQADANFMNNTESKQMFDFDFRDQLLGNLDKMAEVIQDPISIRKWMLSELGDDALVSDLQSGEGMKSISNMALYSALSPDANPMSYSDRYVKNKLYNIYINSVINGMKSATNQYNSEDSHRYGGQAPIIQVPELSKRLRPTLVDREGNVELQGEAMLPHSVAQMTLRELNGKGYEVRLVRKGKTLKPEEILGKELWDSFLNTDVELYGLHHHIDYMKSKGEYPEDVSVGVMIRRNPRTRPNDFGLYSLKGFLEETYGNSVVVNSMDIANVAEGDYDFDKADFFFAHREGMWNHVERASKFFVQGVDPSKYAKPIDFRLGMNPVDAARNKNLMIANGNIFKKSIGLVQKVPRMLGFADKLGAEGIGNTTIETFNESHPTTKFNKPKILLGGNKDHSDFMLVMDYENKDYFQRAALETQLILDASGKLNPDITSDIYNWRQDFIFPTREQSIVPNEMKRNQAGFVNDMRSKGNSEGKRVRIFRKIVKTAEGWDEIDLTPLDRAIVNTMLTEYSKFLGVTNDAVYENTGEQRKSEYKDVVSQSESFFNFTRTLNKSLYWKLRNRFGSNQGLKDKEWKKDKDFIDYFGHEDKVFENFATKQKSPYSISNKDILHPDVMNNGVEYSEGNRGAPVDRILWNFHNADPFRTTTTRTVGGRTGQLIDQWYNELLGGGEFMTGGEAGVSVDQFISAANRLSAADRLTVGVEKGFVDYNRKSELIANLKKKIGGILNSNMRWDAKNASISKLNTFINKLEFEMGTDFLPNDYKKSRKARDLDKIEMIFADDKNVIDGTVYYATLDNVKNMLPGGFALGEPAQKDLKFIRKIRRLFYGNRTRLKDFMGKNGGKTLLTGEEIALINGFPDLSTFYELETKLLTQGFENYGPTFLYSFMQPAQNKKAVGIFNNRPVSVPYQATETFDPSSKYRRGIRLLTGLMSGTEPTSPENQMLAKKQLFQIQFIESTFSRFFNKRVDQRWLVGDEVGDFLDVGALGSSGKMVMYNNLRLPNFNQDFTKLFSDFKSVQWQRDSNRMASGFGTMNDHLIDFYRNVMKLAGKETEFESYLNKMSVIDAEMMSNDIMNPMEYLQLRQNLDKEVRTIAGDIFIGGKLEKEFKGGNQVAKDIMESPVYTLMGGSKYYKKGVSLEREPQYNIERLRDLKDMHESMMEIKNDLNPNQSEAKNEFKEIRDCFN